FSAAPLSAMPTKTGFESDNNHVTPIDQEILPNEDDRELDSVSNGDNDDETPIQKRCHDDSDHDAIQKRRRDNKVSITITEKPGTVDVELAKINTSAEIEKEKTLQSKEETERAKIMLQQKHIELEILKMQLLLQGQAPTNAK
ncbi:hypothetical protein BGZ49_004955, partial [Haplosporangium sp. Z 27]